MGPRIIFMGTPEFAVASLQRLYNGGLNIVAVITAPDKPSGRGLQVQQSAVKIFAVSKNLIILQPPKLKDPEFLAELRALKADLQVVVAFRMLPREVWEMPPLGTVNLHGSLLPQYRGAAPINWAIINGEKITGVTTFKLQHQIDTGNILLQQQIPIEDHDNAGSLHDKMMVIGAELLHKTIVELFNGNLKEHPQAVQGYENSLNHAPKIFTETCQINWENNVTEISNFIRGLSPYPGAFTFLNSKKIKVFEAAKTLVHHNLPAGEVSSDNKTFLNFSAQDGFVSILELQPEGKKRLKIEDFLRGNKVNTK